MSDLLSTLLRGATAEHEEGRTRYDTVLTGLCRVTLSLLIIAGGTLATLSVQGGPTRPDARILVGLGLLLFGVGLVFLTLRKIRALTAAMSLRRRHTGDFAKPPVSHPAA